MIAGMFNGGAMPVLERLVQFTGARHRVIAENVANLSTPYYRPKDLSVAHFREQLGRAVEARRASRTPNTGPLELRSTRQLAFRPDGLTARPEPLDENVMFHDRNNRDLERVMQDLAENTLTHNAGVAMLKNQFDLLKMAIRETP
ncbi:MAG: hypothetical protein AAF800_14840 [Planctomycetota bacterium]